MDRRSMQRLALDKRLIRRRGWISPEDLDRELEKLPDVSHKIAEPEPEPQESSSEAEPRSPE
jgi:hypothetical protein